MQTHICILTRKFGSCLFQPTKLMVTILFKVGANTLPSPEYVLLSATLWSSFGFRSTSKTFGMLGACDNGKPHLGQKLNPWTRAVHPQRGHCIAARFLTTSSWTNSNKTRYHLHGRMLSWSRPLANLAFLRNYAEVNWACPGEPLIKLKKPRKLLMTTRAFKIRCYLQTGKKQHCTYVD